MELVQEQKQHHNLVSQDKLKDCFDLESWTQKERRKRRKKMMLKQDGKLYSLITLLVCDKVKHKEGNHDPTRVAQLLSCQEIDGDTYV